MTPLENYLNAIKTDFGSHNLYFFTIAAILFQFINYYISKYFPIKIYQVASFITLFYFINKPFSAYILVMGGIVASFVSLYVYKIFVYLNKQKRVFLLNIITFITVLSFMILFNCISIPAVAYTLMSYQYIPSEPFTYLYSYIVATIIIIIISYILLIVLSYVNINILHIEQYNENFNQVKENISNWNIISTNQPNSQNEII